MRESYLVPLFAILSLAPNVGHAGPLHDRGAVADSTTRTTVSPKIEMYRGYSLDLSEVMDRKDIVEIADGLKQQVDIIEDVGLSPTTLKFFRAIPIAVDEAACQDAPLVSGIPARPPACFGSGAQSLLHMQRSSSVAVWDREKSQWINKDGVAFADANLSSVQVRPSKLDPQRPIVLQEMLHAYHADMMSRGPQNPAILFYYKKAKEDHAYPDDAHALTNEREFFAVTASVFLYGKDGLVTREKLKEKQPDYFKYLVWLFGFDPDRGPVSPIAMAQ